MKLSTAELLTYCTVRIECNLNNGKSSTGTGFFFGFHESENSQNVIPVVITNKHVVKDAILCRLILTRSINGKPRDTEHQDVIIRDMSSRVKNHPDKDVDLCAIPIIDILNTYMRANIQFVTPFLFKANIPTAKDIDGFDAIEDILMIGYPDGRWDAKNNKPLVRRGITATQLSKDFNNKKEFMIDAACFKGSSGSPIVISTNQHSGKDGNIIIGARFFLVGILQGGPEHTITGKVASTDPNNKSSVVYSDIPMNLGSIIKAERILELESELYNNK